ncbi:MAG: hypothetical protein MMC23_010192 [Stictis urceolatum]|nr:hypothetical protein [Stictis urceolata]
MDSQPQNHSGSNALPVVSIQPSFRSAIVDDNPWEWIHDMVEHSPIQPVANLGTGFIEYNPPGFIIEAHKKALDNNEDNQYAPITGTESLRKTISDLYSPQYGRVLDVESEICVTSGAQEGMLTSTMAFAASGDEVILLEPVFSMYEYQVKMSGATPRYVPLRPPEDAKEDRIVSGNDWRLDMAELEEAMNPKTKAIVLNNPHNPIGKVYSSKELRTIGELCIKHDVLILSDDVYERIAYGSSYTCIASLDQAIAARTLTTISVGKLFNATGWRLGFVIGPKALMRHVIGVHLTLAYASTSPTQEAAAVGLREAGKNGFWERNKKDVQHRVSTICDVLEEIGLAYVAPAGAYFLFVDIRKIRVPDNYRFPREVLIHGTIDWKVSYFLVNEFGISSIPGSCFYSPEKSYLGESYIRFGVCKSDEGLALARERLLQLRGSMVVA